MDIHVTLEQGLDEVSAKWDNDNNRWQVGQRTKYRWVDNITNEPTSDWYYNIEDALEWVKNHDNAVDNSVDKMWIDR
jgi:hypothetical protein